MSKLYIFGDSYSTPRFCVDPSESWWGLVAKELNSKITQVINYSWPGNNIDSIEHVLFNVVDTMSTDDYLIIGIPPLQRLTMFNPEETEIRHLTKFDNNLNQIDVERLWCHEGLAQYSIHQMDKKFINLWNSSWIEAQTIRRMLTTDCYIKKYIKNVLWANLSVPFQPLTQWPVLTKLQELAINKDNFLIFDQTYYSVNLNKNSPADFDTHGWMGHQGPAGNLEWFLTSIKPKIIQLGWV